MSVLLCAVVSSLGASRVTTDEGDLTVQSSSFAAIKYEMQGHYMILNIESVVNLQ